MKQHGKETIAAIRLRNQGLLQQQSGDPHALVRYMGAVQAQDFPMARWALGIRLADCSEARVQEEIDRGSIIRTHVMRPTWHLVAAEDIRWMMALTAPGIRSQMTGRHEALGLTAAMIDKSRRLLVDALHGGKALTRKEINTLFTEAGIKNTDNRLAHLLMRAEQECLICSGPSKGRDCTYALMDDRVPAHPLPDMEESLQRLALRYFTSHGPATLADFTWWSGLPAGKARLALELNKSVLSVIKADDNEYWMAEMPEPMPASASGIWMIPAFDEILISYKDRTAILESHHHAISSNGIFRPVILVNGKVAGLWKKAARPSTLEIEMEFFEKKHGVDSRMLQEAIRRYKTFLDGQASKSTNSRI